MAGHADCALKRLQFASALPALLCLQILSTQKKHSLPPVSLIGQLLWREFFYHVGNSTANFDRMEGNPICKQARALHHLSKSVLVAVFHVRLRCASRYHGMTTRNSTKHGMKPGPDTREGPACELIAPCAHGQLPGCMMLDFCVSRWIDAIMTQLRREGWMHHLARHSVACFLTRGDLYVSWERGRDTFDRLLIDGDWRRAKCSRDCAAAMPWDAALTCASPCAA